MRAVFSPLLGVAGLLAGASVAIAADPPAYYGSSAIDYFYVELEGGYGWNEGSEASFAAAALDYDDGFHGTATFGHISIDNGILGGYVDRAELWFSYFDLGDGTAPPAGATGERRYWEIGSRFQHYYDQNAQNKTMWGIETFLGSFGETAVQLTPPRGAEIDTGTTVIGALLSFEAERYVTDSTMIFARTAAGPYFGAADNEVKANLAPVYTEDSDSLFGVRAQLGVGIVQELTERVSIGLVGRLDYFSDMGQFSTASATGLTEDDFLNLTIGATLSMKMSGTYR